MDPAYFVSTALGVLFLAGTAGLFIVKDVYMKVGEIPALKERINALEDGHLDSKKTNEIVFRLEERLRDLSGKMDLVLATIMKDRNNG